MATMAVKQFQSIEDFNVFLATLAVADIVHIQFEGVQSGTHYIVYKL
jgi:hypothetical protein